MRCAKFYTRRLRLAIIADFIGLVINSKMGANPKTTPKYTFIFNK